MSYDAMIRDCATYLLIDAVFSEMEQEEEYKVLCDRHYRMSIQLEDEFDEMLRAYGLDIDKYLPIASTKKIAEAIDKSWKGKITLLEIWEEYQSAASSEVLGAVGHGVSAWDNMTDWLEERGVTKDPKRPYFESPYNEAYDFLQDCLKKIETEND